MNTNLEIKNRIVKNFEEKLFSFSFKHQAHWAVRMYRLTGESKYIQLIFQDFQIKTFKMWPNVKILGNKSAIKKYDGDLLNNFHPTSLKGERRKTTFGENPGMLAYKQIVEYLFFAKSYGVDTLPQLKSDFDKAIAELKLVDWEQSYLGSDAIQTHPSFIANSVSYLKFLGVTNLVLPAQELFRKRWMQNDPDRDSDYQLKIYGMTHFIISQSLFYQKLVENEQSYSWILNYFEKNWEQINLRCNPDIIAEVGLCFILTSHSNHEIVEKSRKEIMKSFDQKVGYIPREKDRTNMQSAEHRNILAVLLLGGIDKFHKGPNLASLIEENKRTFYIAENLQRIGKPEEVED